MKRQVTIILISVFISYLPVMPVSAQDQTERIILSNKNQVTILYVNDLLDLSCSAIPLSIVLQSISDKTTTKFILTDRTIGKKPVTLSLQQISISNALKRLLRGYSYSSSFENNIETMTVFSSHTGKKASSQPVVSVIKPAEKDPLKTKLEEPTDIMEEIVQEDVLLSLDDFMPIELPAANVAYNEEMGETGNNAAQYRQIAAAEGLWHHAADFGFNDPAVRSIGQ